MLLLLAAAPVVARSLQVALQPQREMALESSNDTAEDKGPQCVMARFPQCGATAVALLSWEASREGTSIAMLDENGGALRAGDFSKDTVIIGQARHPFDWYASLWSYLSESGTSWVDSATNATLCRDPGAAPCGSTEEDVARFHKFVRLFAGKGEMGTYSKHLWVHPTKLESFSADPPHPTPSADRAHTYCARACAYTGQLSGSWSASCIFDGRRGLRWSGRRGGPRGGQAGTGEVRHVAVPDERRKRQGRSQPPPASQQAGGAQKQDRHRAADGPAGEASKAPRARSRPAPPQVSADRHGDEGCLAPGAVRPPVHMWCRS